MTRLILLVRFVKFIPDVACHFFFSPCSIEIPLRVCCTVAARLGGVLFGQTTLRVFLYLSSGDGWIWFVQALLGHLDQQ